MCNIFKVKVQTNVEKSSSTWPAYKLLPYRIVGFDVFANGGGQLICYRGFFVRIFTWRAYTAMFPLKQIKLCKFS